MAAQILAMVVDCRDPRRQAAFWGAALSYEVTERNRDEFKVSDRGGERGSLYFMRVPEPKVVKNRLHLDLVTHGSMEEEVARLTELGARSLRSVTTQRSSRIQTLDRHAGPGGQRVLRYELVNGRGLELTNGHGRRERILMLCHATDEQP
jgi:Glyoxalase-like domain